MDPGSIGGLLAKLSGDPVATSALQGVFILPVVDFVLGSFRAISNGTFRWEAFSTWVRLQLAGHALPIAFALIVGQAFGTITIGDTSVNAVLVAAELAAAAFAATTLKSIVDSLNPRAADVVPVDAT